MIELHISGYSPLTLKHLVLDYNGTIALDGKMIDGVKGRLLELSKNFSITVLTADTHGTAKEELKDIPCEIIVLPFGENHIDAKRTWVAKIGADEVVAIGNGRNDFRMLSISAIGICVIGEEGASFQSIHNADVICPSILSALDLLLNPRRLIATMRSS